MDFISGVNDAPDLGVDELHICLPSECFGVSDLLFPFSARRVGIPSPVSSPSPLYCTPPSLTVPSSSLSSLSLLPLLHTALPLLRTCIRRLPTESTPFLLLLPTPPDCVPVLAAHTSRLFQLHSQTPISLFRLSVPPLSPYALKFSCVSFLSSVSTHTFHSLLSSVSSVCAVSLFHQFPLSRRSHSFTIFHRPVTRSYLSPHTPFSSCPLSLFPLSFLSSPLPPPLVAAPPTRYEGEETGERGRNVPWLGDCISFSHSVFPLPSPSIE